MTALDHATPVRVTIGELLTIPRGTTRDRVIRRAVLRHTATRRAHVKAAREDAHRLVEITPELVEAEAHRLNAQADRIYQRMAADTHIAIRDQIQEAGR